MKCYHDQINYLEGLIRKCRKKLAEATTGKIKINSKGAGQYYLFNADSQTWEYVKQDQIKDLKPIAQRDYEEAVLLEAEKQLAAIKKFASVYNEMFLIEIYSAMHPLRKQLIKPYDISDEEYATNWLGEKYEKSQREMTTAYTTLNNEKVRSKSEALIADKLRALGIPYRYECKLQLSNIVFFPDFTLLDKRNRNVIIYEHFGMMDKSDYGNNCVGKIKTYIQNGYVLGKNLIATFESVENPLDLGVVEKTILSVING